MGQGFSVRPVELQAASRDVAALQGRCQLITRYVVATLTAMAGSAGHAGLTSELTAAAGLGNRAFTGTWAAYGHAANVLAASAQNYIGTEQAIVKALSQAPLFSEEPSPFLRGLSHSPQDCGKPMPAQVSGGGLAVPAGNPVKLESLASELEILGLEAGNLAATTRQAAASIRASADWTGDASDAFGAFAGNLGQGADAARGPLLDIAAAVRRYAGYLSTAQQEAEAYNSLAQAAQEIGDGALLSQVELAGQSAMDAIEALQQAGGQAAAEVASAAGQLQDLFGKQGPVQAWINSQRVGGADVLAGRGIWGSPGGPIPPDLEGTGIYPLPPDLGLPVGDPIPPDLGLPVGDPVPPELGLPIGDPIPPGIGSLILKTPPGPPGPLINYDATSTEGQLGFGPDGEPVPDDGLSNLIRPPLDGDTRYKVYNADNPDHPLTDIDAIEDGALVEYKSATGQHPGMNLPQWIKQNVTTKLYKYEAAREFLPGYENAPIRLVFTQPGATAQFKSAVEQAVSNWREGNPGVDLSVEWQP